VGANYALSTSSCTGALHLSLLALEVGPGDEVIVPDITWVATASAIMYVGATPVFADVNKSDWTINIESLKSLINSKTKAIIPVHLYGFAANMNEIIEIASKGEIFVIEDAAPAIGTELSSKRVGTFGDFGCFSFQGAKLLVTGEGGMLVTNNKELYERAKKILDHGRKPGTFWIEEIGHKYKMNNITAALGLAQLHRVQWQIEKKREIYNWYREELSDLNGINFQEESKLTRSICWMTSFTLAPEFDISRDQLISNLRLNKIDSRPVFPAISQYPIWKYQTKAQPNACNIGQNGINLPSGVLLSRKDVRRVSNAIKGILS
jgi:perosamine synthetase